MDDLPDRRPPQELAANATGLGLAALLGCVALPVGPVAAAVAGAALTPYTTRMVELAAAEWHHKSELIAATAAATSGLDEEEFCARLSGNPDLIALAHKILWAASMSGNEHKLRTLGQLLGGAVKDRGNRLDETQILAAVLAELEAPHVVILDLLSRPEEEYRERMNTTGPLAGLFWWRQDLVEANTPMNRAFVLACLNALNRYGLVFEHNARYALTELGLALAKVMRQARRPRPH